MAGNELEITVVNEDGITLPLTVKKNSYVGEIKALIQNAIGLPVFEQVLLYDGKTLHDLAPISALNLKPGDLICVVQNASQLNVAPVDPLQNIRTQAEEVRQYYLTDQAALTLLLRNDPVLAEAILNDNREVLVKLVKERIDEKNRKKREEENRINQLNANFMDPEVQKQIEEEIRMGNVNENREAAMEHNPESFGRVVMLYIDCSVNNTPVKAFVDSGAQITLMSAKLAERCGIMRLLDRRYATTLVGVGTSQALGRVHVCTIKIGNSFYSSSFTIVDDDRVEFLLGLDMLRKHQCVIDLPNNCLRVGDGEESVPFLSEKDIPKHALGGDLRLSSSNDNIVIPDDFDNNNEWKDQREGDDVEDARRALQNLNVRNDDNNSSNIIINNPPAQNPQPVRQPPPQQNNSGINNEEAIQVIMRMGYTRNQAVEALAMCGGNADAALSLLLFS